MLCKSVLVIFYIICSQIGNLSYECDGSRVFEDCIGTGSHRVSASADPVAPGGFSSAESGSRLLRIGAGDEIKLVLQDGVNRELK